MTAAIVATVGSARGRNLRGGALPDKGAGFGIAARFTLNCLSRQDKNDEVHRCRRARRRRRQLVRGAVLLYRDHGQGTRMVRMLALRVALSASLIVFLVFAYRMGWIEPTGLR
jgi:hypothetical protein